MSRNTIFYFINNRLCLFRQGTILLSLFINFQLHAQRVIDHATPVSGSIVLATGIEIPEVSPGYTVWLPDHPEGLVLFTHSRRDTVNQDQLIKACLKNDLAIMFASTSNRLEFLFDEERCGELYTYLEEVITSYKIPRKNLLFCGMSLEGTRALRLVIYARQKGLSLIPRAIAICDAPLDMTRFHAESKRASALNFHPASANEGRWVSEYLAKNLGGTPEESPDSYIQYSPFTYHADDGGNAEFFRDIFLRAYTEPDVHWWMAERRKDYYGMNSIDLAAMVNQLNILGNENAELITTENKGYLPDGIRHPHSWSIVDEEDLIKWFKSIISKK